MHYYSDLDKITILAKDSFRAPQKRIVYQIKNIH